MTLPKKFKKEDLTFEKTWAMFQESDRRMQETDRQFKEFKEEREKASKELDLRMKETDLRMKETDRRMKETDLKMKETDRLIGNLGNRFGELVEHLVAPSIMQKFNELGFNFSERSENHEITEPGDPDVYTEVDIMLGNGEIAIAVEIKAKPKQADVDEHITRMDILRKRADRHGDKRKYQGAIAGAIMTKPVHEYILRKGFYAIEQTGDTVRIEVPDIDSCPLYSGKPREW